MSASAFKFLERASPYLPDVLLWGSVSVGLLLVGYIIIRRFPKDEQDNTLVTSDMMNSFRDLHDGGQLSDDEYRSIKAKLASRLKQELADPAESPEYPDNFPHPPDMDLRDQGE